MVVFETPGVIDINVIKIMGVSAKNNENPIGEFGTGLKYALAVLLRNGLEVIIQSNRNVYTFGTEKLSIRDKNFDIITMKDKWGTKLELGFTTQLGSKWTLENAFRELFSNTMDEDGTYYKTHDVINLLPDKTYIFVKGKEFESVFDNRWDFIFKRENKIPIITSDFLDIYNGENKNVFYKGIAAYKVPTRFTYNIKQKMDLTEDRTIASQWLISRAISLAVFLCSDEDFIREMLTPREGFLEEELQFPPAFHSGIPTKEFKKVSLEMIAKAQKTNRTIFSYINSLPKTNILYPRCLDFSEDHKKIVEKCSELLEKINLPHPHEFIFSTDSLEEGLNSYNIEGKIYISNHCFDLGIEYVLTVLIEEKLKMDGCKENSTHMQSSLLDIIANLLLHGV